MVGAGLGVGALVVGAVFAAGALRGGGATSGSGYGQPGTVAAVTEEPGPAWSWRPPTGEEDFGVVAAGKDTYVSYWLDDGAEVAALDTDGKERWSVRPSKAESVIGVSPDHDVLLVGPYEDGSALEALSTDDGTTLWSSQAGWMIGVGDHGVLVSKGSTLSMLDTHSGDEKWHAKADYWSTTDGRAFVVVGDALRAIDLGSGRATWTAPVPVDYVNDGYIELAACDDVVVVAGDTEAVGLDSENGERLWSASRDGSTDTVGRATDHLVYLAAAPDTDNYVDGEATFYGADGEVGAAPISVDDGYFSAVSASADGTDYVIDTAGGDVYDESLKHVATIPGEVITAVEGGAYSSDVGELAFYDLADSRRVWGITIPGDGSPWVIPADHAVLVVHEGRLTRYE